MECDKGTLKVMLIRFFAILVLGLPILVAQDSRTSVDGPQMAEADFDKAVRDGLPLSEAHSASVFVLNHEEIAIPLLLREVKRKLEDKSAEEFITSATGLIAYSASNRGIDAVAELCSLDEKRFSTLIERLLNHAINREREYDVSYYAVENHSKLRELVGRWVEDSLRFPLSDGAFAIQMLRREKVDRSISENDALLTLLPVATRERIVRAVEKARNDERQRLNERK